MHHLEESIKSTSDAQACSVVGLSFAFGSQVKPVLHEAMFSEM